MTNNEEQFKKQAEEYVELLSQFIKEITKGDTKKDDVEEDDEDDLNIWEYISEPDEKHLIPFWAVLMVFDYCMKHEIEDVSLVAYHEDRPKDTYMTVVMEEEWIEGKKVSTPNLAIINEDEECRLVMKPDMWFDDKWYIRDLNDLN